MGLPQRVFYSVNEVAVRWECSLADIAGSASVGYFDIVTVVPSISIGDARRIEGFVRVAVTDVLPILRGYGKAAKKVRLSRVRPWDDETWVFLEDLPAGKGLKVLREDLLIMADQVRAFEAEHDILRRPAARIGSSPRYDWESMYISQIVRVFEQGLPDTQSEWIGEVQDWFAETSEDGQIPDERTIRRRLSPIWKALKT
jgi:hypothetical protein